jgi:hypothetical protein
MQINSKIDLQVLLELTIYIFPVLLAANYDNVKISIWKPVLFSSVIAFLKEQINGYNTKTKYKKCINANKT